MLLLLRVCCWEEPARACVGRGVAAVASTRTPRANGSAMVQPKNVLYEKTGLRRLAAWAKSRHEAEKKYIYPLPNKQNLQSWLASYTSVSIHAMDNNAHTPLFVYAHLKKEMWDVLRLSTARIFALRIDSDLSSTLANDS